jgi:hypothetical protein
MQNATATHCRPAWAEYGDYSLSLKLDFDPDDAASRKDESLWCKKIGQNNFQICCIPFFAFNLALGDEVIAHPTEEGYYDVCVSKSSGHSTFRIKFPSNASKDSREGILRVLSDLGCVSESYSAELSAIDAPSDTVATQVLAFLIGKNEEGLLKFEAGSTHWFKDEVFQHHRDKWRPGKEFHVYADISRPEEGTKKWEQLSAKQKSQNIYEIACIPFFAYDINLGDEVETREHPENYLPIIERVVNFSGHYTFRASFRETNYPAAREETPIELVELGCSLEWFSCDLLAIDAPPNEWQPVADLLWQREQLGHLAYETGRLKSE